MGTPARRELEQEAREIDAIIHSDHSAFAGLLDLGGASAQIAFAISRESAQAIRQAEAEAGTFVKPSRWGWWWRWWKGVEAKVVGPVPFGEITAFGHSEAGWIDAVAYGFQPRPLVAVPCIILWLA